MEQSSPAPSAGTAPPGIDVEPVTAWLEANVPGARGPLTFAVIAGGHSNLTFKVTDADDHAYVLRRPPLSHGLPSAHDMGREHRIIAALADTLVPVPPALGFCDDEAVNGAPFYVMGFVDGLVIRRPEDADEHLTLEARTTASDSLVDTLASLHAVDFDAVGLGDLGRRDGYIERQLKRWHGQWNAQKTRDLPAIDAVHARLRQRIPPQTATAIVHGDYRLDNCMVRPDGTVAAVLDWEICTLGDPLADVGLLQVYWTGPGDEPSAWGGGATAAPGFRDRAEVLARYAEVSGRDVAGIDFYIAFAYWKLACIIEGVYARYLGGALGDVDEATLAPFAAQVEAAAEHATAYAGRLP
jgi:aminoglycoside phosphotransferase (APT) family kinase protein